MRHFKVLKILNYAFAGLLLLAMLITFCSMILSVVIMFLSVFLAVGELDPSAKNAALAAGISEVMSPVVFTIVFDAIVMAILFIVSLLMFFAGREIGKGRGRLLQTLAAALAVVNCPPGTLYAAYALWVCWINDETADILSGDAEVL